MEGARFKYVTGDSLKSVKKSKTGKIQAVPTPIPTWNSICGEEGGGVGLARGWTVVIGGRPGSRKSSLALNLAAEAVRNGDKVGAINFEMSFAGYATRYLSALAGIPAEDLGWGSKFKPDQWKKACAEADRIYGSEGGALISNETAVFSLSEIRDAYAAFEKEGVVMVIVDYVQLVRSEGGDFAERAGNIANTLRELSLKHNMVTVAASQINREGMKGGEDSPPRMHHLYGGMYWEANAAQVVMLDHTYMDVDLKADVTRTKLVVDKNRHGMPLVDIPIIWNHRTGRVEEDTGYQISGVL